MGDITGMRDRGLFAILATCAALGTLSVATAQQAPFQREAQVSPKNKPFDQRFDGEELTPAQIQRAQDIEPAAKAAPKPPAPKAAQPARTVSCSGVFAKDSNHLKLTNVFKPYKGNKDKVVIIRIDRDAKFHTMVDIIDELDMNNLSRFSLQTLGDKEKQEVESL